jgi:hydrogenase nickel incorporation protein HypA/HybF
VHELPLVTRIVDLALGATPPGRRVSRVELSVGELCGVEPGWIERYFRVASRGTACEGAELSVAAIPAAWRCAACGGSFGGVPAPGEARLSCPACGGGSSYLEEGSEWRLERIELAETGEGETA